MKPKTALNIVVKVLYILPAVLWCTIALCGVLIDGFRNIVLSFWLYPFLSVFAAALLWKGKWWGCASGIFMGIMMFTQLQNEQVSGLRYCVYFAIMGILCCVISQKEGNNI